MRTKNKQQSSGFTIVELLIVIVVIGILAAITIVAYNGIQQRARDGERQQDIAGIQKVLELYYVDNNAFPNTYAIRDPVWRAANLATKDQSLFINPQHSGGTNSINGSGSAVAVDRYSYYSLKSDGSLCIENETACTGYRMAWKLEANPTVNLYKNVDR